VFKLLIRKDLNWVKTTISQNPVGGLVQ